MLTTLRGKVWLSVKSNKSLLTYTFINYFDKFITFSLPLIVLYLIKDINLYNNVEYILSFANVGVVVAELGTRLYFLYGYRIRKEESKAYIERVTTYFYWVFFLYSTLGILTFSASLFLSSISNLVPLIFIRVLVLYFINFFSVYYRLIDRPQNILFFNILINVLTIVFVMMCYNFLGSTQPFYFFLAQLLFLIYIFFKSVKKIQLTQLNGLINYIQKAVSFSWPLVINILIVTFINNYGKIYAFNHFTEGEMYNFSYVLRLAMIVQLAHASVITFYSKAIITDKTNKLNYQIYKAYNVFIFVAVILVFFILIAINMTSFVPRIPIDINVLIIIAYVLLWCQQSFFEGYLSRMNKNKLVLIFSVIGSVVYILMLTLKKEIDITYISLSMLVSMLINLTAVIYYVRKKNVI